MLKSRKGTSAFFCKTSLQLRFKTPQRSCSPNHPKYYFHILTPPITMLILASPSLKLTFLDFISSLKISKHYKTNKLNLISGGSAILISARVALSPFYIKNMKSEIQSNRIHSINILILVVTL